MSETLTAPTFQEIQESVARGEESKWNIGPDGEMLSEGFTMDSTGTVVWVGEGPEPDDKTAKIEETEVVEETIPKVVEKTTKKSSASEQLHTNLVKDGLYSKGYEEFQEQFSTPSAQENLYKAMKKDKLYNKNAGDFMNTFFPIQDEETEVKEEPTVTTEEGAVSTNVDDSTITPDTETKMYEDMGVAIQ